MADIPFVSCLCVAGKDEFNLKHLLPVAVECFKRQTYPMDRRELVIVVDRPLADRGTMIGGAFGSLCEKPSAPYYGKVKFRIFAYTDERPTLGALRNFSIDKARGPLCLQWDSDDWHHPERIARQVQAYLVHPGLPVFLKRQLCYSFTDDTAFIREFDNLPIIGTILHPKNDFRYPEKEKSEDMNFFRLWSEHIVFDNDPALYLHLEHGYNTWDKGHILREFNAPWAKGGWFLSDSMRTMLYEALRQYPNELLRANVHHTSWDVIHVKDSRGLREAIRNVKDLTVIPMLEVEDG